jgi:predicted nucleotidyltransferase
MRAYWQERPTGDLGYWVPSDPRPAAEIVQSLADLGLLEHRFNSGGEAWWRTTISGNALAHASFRRPIKRATAERHLKGVIERAEAFNTNAKYLVDIVQLAVFGSYLNPTVDRLGDLDLWVVLRSRLPDDLDGDERTTRRLDYAYRTGRRFPQFIDALTWAEDEAVLYLRHRSPVINITRQDITEFAERWDVVYTLAEAPNRDHALWGEAGPGSAPANDIAMNWEK